MLRIGKTFCNIPRTSLFINQIASRFFSSNRVFATNISWQAEEKGFKEHFEQAGPVKEVQLFRRKLDNKLLGSGVVVYEDEESAANAIRTLNNSEYLGRMLLIREDVPREGRPVSDNRPRRSFEGRPRGDNNYRQRNQRRSNDDGDRRGDQRE